MKFFFFEILFWFISKYYLAGLCLSTSWWQHLCSCLVICIHQDWLKKPRWSSFLWYLSLLLIACFIIDLFGHLFIPYIFYFNVARALLEHCSSGKEDSTSSLGSANSIIDSTDTKFQHVNVLVTSGSLIPSLVKCLLFRLDNWIAHGNG